MPRVRHPLGRWSVIAACAALGLPGVAGAKDLAATQSGAAQSSASVSIAPRSITRPIARGFLGLAF
jgi:hypothetical protein